MRTARSKRTLGSMVTWNPNACSEGTPDTNTCVMSVSPIAHVGSTKRDGISDSSRGAASGAFPLQKEHDPSRTFLWIQRRSEEHTSELQSLRHLVCRLLL